MPATTLQIAVSYAWKEEASGPEARSVETLCTEAQQAGASVLRDTHSLSIGENLRDFMRRIGTAEFLCIFLSDPYLRSANCMNELLIAWNHCDGKPEEFFARVKVWVMPSASAIFGAAGRVAYADYWDVEHKKQKAALKKRLGKHSSARDVEDLDRVAEYASKVNAILPEIARRLAAPNFKEFKDWVCGQLPGLCQPGFGAPVAGSLPLISSPAMSLPITASSAAVPDFDQLYAELTRVFPTQVRQIEKILAGNEALRTFLCGKFGITEPSHSTAAALIPRFFVQWSPAIAYFSIAYEDQPDQEAVLDLTGSVLYLAMEPAYAAALQPGAIDIPVAANRSVVGGIEEILICWTRGAKPRVTSPGKVVEPFATPPQMKKDFGYLKRDLMRLLDVIPEDPQAEAKLEEAISRKERFRSPAYIHVHEDDSDLLAEIRRPDSPLKYLLVFILSRGATIRPGATVIWDDNVERDIRELDRHLNFK